MTWDDSTAIIYVGADDRQRASRSGDARSSQPAGGVELYPRRDISIITKD
jgi:hypothetical protein